MVDEMQVRRILGEIKTIAVVGCSKDPAKDAHRVPKYMQMNGYRIIPVNPTATEILGEKAYPSLDAVPIPFDSVDIFRPSPDVPPIVDQAIKSPAKVIWMQLGIRNDAAAKKAQAAGKIVIQDRCMMRDHARLFGKAILELRGREDQGDTRASRPSGGGDEGLDLSQDAHGGRGGAELGGRHGFVPGPEAGLRNDPDAVGLRDPALELDGGADSRERLDRDGDPARSGEGEEFGSDPLREGLLRGADRSAPLRILPNATKPGAG